MNVRTIKHKTKYQRLDNVLTIDVGMNTGYAYWDLNCGWNEKANCPLPVDYGQFSVKPSDVLEYDIIDLADEFENLIDERFCWVRLCVLEGVELWAGSLKSMTSAVKGNLFKLAYIVGMYADICRRKDIEFRIISAASWKGQLKDPVVAEKVERFTGIKLIKSHQHTIDAIGIGLSLMGYFERRTKRTQKTRRFKIGNKRV